MQKETFSHEEAVLGMAGLLLTIQILVEALKDSKETFTTEFILSQYNMTSKELSYIFSKRYFAVIGEEDGRVYFTMKTDPREMGSYDEQEKTFRWSCKGLRRVLTLLSEEGRYPADFVIRHFIGNEDPVKIIKKNNNKQ